MRNERKTKRTLPRKRRGTIKRDIFFIIYISHGTTMSETDLAFVSSEFNIFARKPPQLAIQETSVVQYKPIASIGQSDLEFLIPADFDTYIDPDIKLYVKGKLTKADVSALHASDHTAGANNFLHSLFSQCSFVLNGVNITHSGELYKHRAILETLFSYGFDANISHLTNSYWYKDVGDMLPCDPTKAQSTNTGFINRWNRQKQSKEIEMCGRIHSDICKVPKFLLPGIKLEIKFTKAKPSFYLMNTSADSKTTFNLYPTARHIWCSHGTAHRTNAPYVLRCGHLYLCACVAINVYKL